MTLRQEATKQSVKRVLENKFTSAHFARQTFSIYFYMYHCNGIKNYILDSYRGSMGLIFHTSPFRRQYILFSCRIGLIIEMHPMSICIHNQCFRGNRENLEMVCNHY